MAYPRKSKPSFDKVLGEISKGKIKPIYVFHGPNTPLIEQAISALKERVVGDNEDFGYIVIRGEETNGAKISAEARTVPMLADKQLVVVRNADALGADDHEILLPYFEKPTSSTCLVLVLTKADKRFKFFQKINKMGYLHEAASMTERDLPGWIMSRAQDHDLELTRDAVQVLAESVGTEASGVEDAIVRLSLYVGDRKATAEDVEDVVSVSRMRSVFELTDAIGRRDVSGALRTLDNMLRNKEAPLRLLATLATHTRRLLMAAELGPDVLRRPLELASELGVPPFLGEKISSQARRYSRGELRKAMERLARTDRELKSSRRSETIIMEEMILDLCMGRP